MRKPISVETLLFQRARAQGVLTDYNLTHLQERIVLAFQRARAQGVLTDEIRKKVQDLSTKLFQRARAQGVLTDRCAEFPCVLQHLYRHFR